MRTSDALWGLAAELAERPADTPVTWGALADLTRAAARSVEQAEYEDSMGDDL